MEKTIGRSQFALNATILAEQTCLLFNKLSQIIDRIFSNIDDIDLYNDLLDKINN